MTVKFAVFVVAVPMVALTVLVLTVAVVEITKLAVMVVAFTQVGDVTVMPVPLTFNVTEVQDNVVPVIVIGTVVP